MAGRRRRLLPGPRTHSQLVAGHWKPKGAEDDSAVPVPSSSAHTEPRPASVYAATKLAQEHILQAWTAAHGSGLTVLRLQNVYGPGQSLQNPYTGVVSYFFSSAQEGRVLEVYEDGQILRDFVFIDDVVDALAGAVEHPVQQTRRLDIGSGAETSIHELACRIASLCAAPEPVIVGKFRDGDVRAAICENQPAIDQLGWRPKWTLESGLRALLDSFDVRSEASR